MDTFNLKKYLVENKLTTLSRLVNESNLEDNSKIIKWLGSEGLYTPGMQGLDGLKAHLVDIPEEEIESERYSNLDRADQSIVLGLSLDTLTDGQLIVLGLANYEGTRLDDLPDFIRKFSIDDKWFTLDENQIEDRYSTLSRAVNYFINEPRAVEDWPFWLRSLVVSRFNQQAGFSESRVDSAGGNGKHYVKVLKRDYKKAKAVLVQNIDTTYVKMHVVDDDKAGNVIFYFIFRNEHEFDFYDDPEGRDVEDFYTEPAEDVGAFIYDAVEELQAYGIKVIDHSTDSGNNIKT